LPGVFPDAVQTIPPSTNDGSTVAKSATGDFPLAAIICVAIVGGIIFLFICYRLYVRLWRRRQQSAAYDTYSSSDEPKSPNPLLQHHHPLMTQRATMYGSSSFSPFGPSTSSSTLLYPAYAHGSYSSRGSLAALSSEGSLNNITNQQHFFAGGHSAESSHTLSTSDSRMATLNQLEGGGGGIIAGPSSSSSSFGSNSRPTSPQGLPRHNSQFGSLNYIRGDSSMSTDQLRTQGSRLSTFQAATRSRESLGGRRSMLSPQQFGSQSSLSVPLTTRPASSRISGAPHLRHSRIEIVPPQPLAPPPGTVVATDKSTLAFSSLSGIGTPDRMPNSVSGWFKPDQASPSSTSTASSSSLASSARHVPQPPNPNPPKRSNASESTTRSEGSSSMSSGENLPPHSTQYMTPGSRSEKDNVPRANSPQSPLDKLKKQLEGHASQMSSSAGSPDRRREKASSGVVTQEDIEAYRRG